MFVYLKLMSAEDLTAFLIHTPEDFNRVDNKAAFKSRFLKAREIPYHFVKENRYNDGWIVLSQDKWARRNKHGGYHVYKTRFNVWLCECEDFIRTQMICKHAIRVMLLNGRGAMYEKGQMDSIIKLILESDAKIYQTQL